MYYAFPTKLKKAINTFRAKIILKEYPIVTYISYWKYRLRYELYLGDRETQ